MDGTEISELVRFFRDEEAEWGRKGDCENWSPERSAIELIRSLRAALRGGSHQPEETLDDDMWREVARDGHGFVRMQEEWDTLAAAYRDLHGVLEWMASFTDASLQTAATLHWDLVGRAKEVLSRPTHRGSSPQEPGNPGKGI